MHRRSRRDGILLLATLTAGWLAWGCTTPPAGGGPAAATDERQAAGPAETPPAEAPQPPPAVADSGDEGPEDPPPQSPPGTIWTTQPTTVAANDAPETAVEPAPAAAAPPEHPASEPEPAGAQPETKPKPAITGGEAPARPQEASSTTARREEPAAPASAPAAEQKPSREEAVEPATREPASQEPPQTERPVQPPSTTDTEARPSPPADDAADDPSATNPASAKAVDDGPAQETKPGPPTSIAPAGDAPPGPRDPEDAAALTGPSGEPLKPGMRRGYLSMDHNPTTLAGRGAPATSDVMRPAVWVTLDDKPGTLRPDLLQWFIEEPVSKSPTITVWVVEELVGDLVDVQITLRRFKDEDPAVPNASPPADPNWQFGLSASTPGIIKPGIAYPLCTGRDFFQMRTIRPSESVDSLPLLTPGRYAIIGYVTGTKSPDKTLVATYFTVGDPAAARGE